MRPGGPDRREPEAAVLPQNIGNGVSTWLPLTVLVLGVLYLLGRMSANSIG
jgi:hypothetical protein